MNQKNTILHLFQGAFVHGNAGMIEPDFLFEVSSKFLHHISPDIKV